MADPYTDSPEQAAAKEQATHGDDAIQPTEKELAALEADRRQARLEAAGVIGRYPDDAPKAKAKK